MNPFDWADPLALDDQLREDERLVRDAAQGFAQSVLEPRVVADFRDEREAPEIIARMGEAGLLGVTLPPEHGGAGASHVAYGLAAREIERVDSGYRSMASVQSSLVIHPIHAFGTSAQQARYLPALARGELVGSFALTEPEAGSDPGSLRTVARQDGDGFRLTGTKTWITNAPIAGLCVVWARSEAHGGRVRGFLVERGAPGVTVSKIAGKLSLRTSATGTIALDDVRLGADALLPGADGLKAPFACLNRARYGIAWGATGAAEACYAAAREYGLDRRQFGKPLAANQLYQAKLADMASEIALGLQAALRVGRLLETGTPAPETISLIKRNNAAKALAIARAARDMHGANGISEAYPVMRHMLNLETVVTYEGTHDIHGLILGRAITGIAAF